MYQTSVEEILRADSLLYTPHQLPQNINNRKTTNLSVNVLELSTK